MDNEVSSSNYLSFSFLGLIIKRHLKLILSSIVFFVAISSFITYGVMRPKYTSTTDLLVNQKLSKSQAATQPQQLQADVQRIYTYKDIITSPAIQNTVKKDLAGEPGMTKKPNISVKSQENSQVFSVSATANNPYTASDIANETAKVFQNKIKKMMDINSVTIVSKATPVLKPTSPYYMLNILSGLLIGLLIGLGASLLSEFNDKSVKNVDYLEDLGLNNLGLIYEIDKSDMKIATNKHGRRIDNHERRV